MALNPVERRLTDLCADWVAFRDDTAKRLLLWRVRDDAARLLQCFFEVQKHDTPYTSGDLFIVFDVAFDNSIQYSRELKTALFGQYEASRQGLAEEGIAPDWRVSPEQFPDSAYGFIQSVRSFGSTHHKSIGHLVVVLTDQARDLLAAVTARLRDVLQDVDRRGIEARHRDLIAGERLSGQRIDDRGVAGAWRTRTQLSARFNCVRVVPFHSGLFRYPADRPFADLRWLPHAVRGFLLADALRAGV